MSLRLRYLRWKKRGYLKQRAYELMGRKRRRAYSRSSRKLYGRNWGSRVTNW